MASYLSIGALVSGVISLILLIISIMASRKPSITDGDRKKSNMYQIGAIVLLLISLGLTALTTFYPSIGMQYSSMGRSAMPVAQRVV